MPGKKNPPAYTKEQLVQLADKDIYIIDGEKYIKVEEVDEKGDRRYVYVKVDRYLAGEVKPAPLEAARSPQVVKQGVQDITEQEGSLASVVEGEQGRATPRRFLKHPYLKRKIAVIPFEDRTSLSIERFGEIIAQRLSARMEDEAFTILVVDQEVVRLALAKGGLNASDFSDPAKTKLLNKALGVQGVIIGTVYGPFVSTAAEAERQKASLAIVRIDARLIDAAEGRILKEIMVTNPTAGSEEVGALCEDRAKHTAADLAIDKLMNQIIDAVNEMDWLTRIALVEGHTVYLQAGNQTGLRRGDLLEVYPVEDTAGKRPIGKIKVSRLFGVDAAVAEVIEGRVQVGAIVKPPLQG